MTDAVPFTRMFRRVDLASLLGVSVRTLEEWDKRDYGPQPVRVGRSIRYSSEMVDQWIRTVGKPAISDAFHDDGDAS